LKEKVLIPNFPLTTTFLINCTPNLVAPLLAFNYAVWKFRKPAQASLFIENLDWLLSKLSDHAKAEYLSTKKPAPKYRKCLDPDFIEQETIIHNNIVSSIDIKKVFCYTDGSASPNPGPSGAGACIFVPHTGLLVDLGASLGRGTNNTAELYALGMLLTHLTFLKKNSLVHLSTAVIFCDSQLAIRAATTSKPKTTITLTSSVSTAYKTLSSLLNVELHWIRGHAHIGGNEE